MSFIRSLNIKVVLKAICSQGEVPPTFSIYIYFFGSLTTDKIITIYLDWTTKFRFA